MPKKPVQVEEKIAALQPPQPKKKYSFWPLKFREVTAPEKVTLHFAAASSEEFSLKADLVFLKIQGDSLPNYFCLEFDKYELSNCSSSKAFETLVDNFSRLGNTSDLTVETAEFSVVCYRPICTSREQRYANFCFKRSQDA